MLSASQLRSWPKDEKIAAYLLQTWRSSSEVKLVSIVSLFIKLLAPSFPLWPHLFLLLLLFFKSVLFFALSTPCSFISTSFLSLCLIFSLYMYVCWFVNLLVPSSNCVFVASSLPLFLLSCAKWAVVVFSLLSYMLLNFNIYFWKQNYLQAVIFSPLLSSAFHGILTCQQRWAIFFYVVLTLSSSVSL